LRLGSHFECPKCHRATRLTEKTTRKADLFVPPPDAPHHVEPSSTRRVLVCAVLAFVAAALAWAVFGPGEEAFAPEAASATSSSPSPVGPTEAPPPTATPPVAPPPAEGAAPTAAEDPAQAEQRRLEREVEAAQGRLARADAEVTLHEQALAAWDADHPLLVEVIREQKARLAFRDALVAGIAEIEAQGPTPAAYRALHASLVASAEADPSRARVIEQVVDSLRQDPVLPVRVSSWREATFHAPRFVETLEDRITAARQAIPNDHARLETVIAEARTAREEALRALEALRAAAPAEPGAAAR
jgi:hypothetical protein